MRRSRVTVTVRPEVLAAAEQNVSEGRATSVSAWVDQAMEEKARRDDLAELLAEMATAGDPVGDEDEAWARSVLGL